MAGKKSPLKTKLAPRLLPLLADEKRQREVVIGWAQEDHEKLLLLAAEMGVAEGPSMFYELALALARKHCVGFQQRAIQTKWTEGTLGFLVVEVERLIADRGRNPGHTVTWAAGVLARRPEWSEFVGGASGEALRVQYGASRKSKAANVARQAFKYHEATKTLEEWDTQLREGLRFRWGQNDP